MALAAGSLWSGGRVLDALNVPHLAFVPFWTLSAILALAWNSRVAAHLVTLAALAWWCAAAIAPSQNELIVADGAALLLGAGLLCGNAPSDPLRSFGVTLSAYGAFALAAVAAFAAAMSGVVRIGFVNPPDWAVGCGFVGVILAVTATAAERRVGSIFAGISIVLVLVVDDGWAKPATGEPWLAYALELVAMLCLVVSGMLDGSRARVVAGWLGLAAVIASVTWAVKGSLLRRSIFLAAAGAVAIVFAVMLGRLLPKESRP